MGREKNEVVMVEEEEIEVGEEVEIEKVFILAPEHRPCLFRGPHGSEEEIPVVDLSPLFLHGCPQLGQRGREAIVEQVGRACREWGFFQLTNHGLPLHLLEQIRAEARAFFALPRSEKASVRRSAQNPLGYYDTEYTKNVRDWKEVFDLAVCGEILTPTQFETDNDSLQVCTNQWPQQPQGFREACEQYLKVVEDLAFTLLGLIASSLGLPDDRFHDYFKQKHSSFLRLNYYPTCPAPELALGVSRHKDSGALTVLHQDDVGGLQVRRSDGEWIGVKPDPSAFVINVGDMIQVWSNDKYKSVEHRVVVNEKKERFSIPLFFNPRHDVDISPLPELIDAENPPKYSTINWGKFYRRKSDTNFQKLNVENLQIYHYAINR